MARLSSRQRKEIRNAYRFSEEELITISAYHADWGNRSEDLKVIKDSIRDHYIEEQGELCSFCKLPLRTDNQVEHLIPKAGPNGKFEYSFEPLNLSVACSFCNTRKSTNNDFIGDYGDEYPTNRDDFNIIHPHFDRYLANIRIVDKSRYEGVTKKGINTIERCKLYEEPIANYLVQCYRYQDDPIISSWLRVKDLKDEFVEKIDRLMNKII